jgi:hypothetical protein
MVKQVVICFCLILVMGSLCSCGNSPKEGNEEKEQETLVFTPSKTPIQRQIYNIQLGVKYSYEELLFELQKNIDNLVSEKNDDILSHRPELHVSTDNNYLTYYVFSLSKYSQQYLFGNQYWDDFYCYSTLDGRIYDIEFSSSGKGIYALAHKNLYQKLLEQLSQKYGEPNHFPDDADYRAFWMDDTTILELYCSHKTDDDFGSISIEYRDNDIFNEVINQQETKGYNEL